MACAFEFRDLVTVDNAIEATARGLGPYFVRGYFLTEEHLDDLPAWKVFAAETLAAISNMKLGDVYFQRSTLASKKIVGMVGHDHPLDLGFEVRSRKCYRRILLTHSEFAPVAYWINVSPFGLHYEIERMQVHSAY